VRVVLSNQAEIDLEEIGDYIAADNPARAVSFVREVRDHFQQIAKAPLAYTQRPELGDGVRSCTHGNYLILFIPDEHEIFVTRVIHGRRDLGTLLSDEG
jgi:toxin ParE1/3/4